jgi:hypothetical protein
VSLEGSESVQYLPEPGKRRLSQVAERGGAMAETLTTGAVGRSFRPSFFFWITVVMAGFVFSGFALTYLQPMAAGTLGPLPPAIHVHGLFYFSWMILLIVQSLLVNVKNVPLHRSVGTFGIVIATSLLLSGALITILFARSVRANPPADYYFLMYLSVVALISFGALFCLAIRNTRRPETHRRLILFATINLLPPGINRLYIVSFGLSEAPLLATFLTMDILALAILIHEWRAHRRISAASWTGVAFVLVPQLLCVPIASSAAFVSLTGMLADLARYR